jgi:hypothetical protein
VLGSKPRYKDWNRLLADCQIHRKHVFADIEPYQCTFLDCQSPDQTYAERKQWMAHEDQHRGTFHCGVPAHDAYNDKMQFIRHFLQVHKIRLDAESLMSLAVFQKPAKEGLDLSCPLCQQDMNGLRTHVAHHLERLAMFALPRTYDDSTDVISNSQVQLSVVPSAGHDEDESQASGDSHDWQQFSEDDDLDEETRITIEGQAMTDVPDSEMYTWTEVKPELSKISDNMPSRTEIQAETGAAVLNAIPPYLYKRISRKALRLIRIYPDVSQDLFRISIFERDGEDYEALSYTWGNDPPHASIVVVEGDNLYRLRISGTLMNALIHLRPLSAPNPRLVWIDALCINQQNISERNNHLSRMGQIFAQASRVLVWLGEEADNSDRGLQLLSSVANIDLAEKVLSDVERAYEWEAVFQLLQRPYFQRQWVIQELACARKAVVYCGQSSMGWAEFADAVNLVDKRRDELHAMFHQRADYQHKPRFLPDKGVLVVTRLIEAVNSTLRMSDDGQTTFPLRTLEDLVCNVSLIFQTTDPKDAIYSVLGLARDPERPLLQSEQEKIGSHAKEAEFVDSATTHLAALRERLPKSILPVDYSKSFFEVCRDFWSFTMDSTKSLDLLCRPWTPIVYSSEQMPSWMINRNNAPFSCEIDGKLVRTGPDSLVGLSSQQRNIYEASGSIPCQWSLPAELDRALLVDGFVFDEIGVLSEPCINGNIPLSWLDFGCWKDGSTPLFDRFWRTLVADRDSKGGPVPAWYSRACEELFTLLDKAGDLTTEKSSQAEKLPSTVEEILRRMVAVVWNRKMMLTRTREYLGLTPGSACPGDLICIIFGCSVPVVLRRNPEDHTHRLVGECYVHGVSHISNSTLLSNVKVTGSSHPVCKCPHNSGP